MYKRTQKMNETIKKIDYRGDELSVVYVCVFLDKVWQLCDYVKKIKTKLFKCCE